MMIQLLCSSLSFVRFHFDILKNFHIVDDFFFVSFVFVC